MTRGGAGLLAVAALLASGAPACRKTPRRAGAPAASPLVGAAVVDAGADPGEPYTLTLIAGIATDLVLSDQHVYWLELGTQGARDGRLLRMPRRGGRLEVVAAGLAAPSALVIDHDELFWTSLHDGQLQKLQLVAGRPGAPMTLVPGQPGAGSEAIAVDGDNVFFAGRKSGKVGVVDRGGGFNHAIVWRGTYPNSIATHAGVVYWLERGADTLEWWSESTTARTDIPAGPLLHTGPNPSALRVDARALYWIDDDGLHMLEHGQGSAQLLLDGDLFPTLAVAGVYAYVFRSHGDLVDLVRVPTHGGGDVNRIAGTDWPSAIEVGDDAIYVLSQRTPQEARLLRLPL